VSTTPTGPAWPVVGRQRELEQIADLLGRADLSGIVLAGEAGVGKTRLVEHCLEIGQRVGFSTERVVATRAASRIPLGALASITTTGTGASASADAIGQAIDSLRSLGAERPLLLAVDDAHLLDDASAVVVQQAATTTGAFIVATIRIGEVAPDAVTSLWKEGLAARIDLEPLTVEDVAQLATSVVNGTVDRATVRMLFDVSEGNPLYLRELLVAALEAGHLSESGGVWRLTTITRSLRLVELVEARLSDLDPQARSALEYLSFGEPLELPLLERLVDAEVLTRLDDKALLRIETQTAVPEVRLAHPLHGEVVQAGVSRLRAMAICRRLAELLTEPGPLPARDVMRVAIWYLDSAGPIDADLALEAARTAQLSHAPELAERLARAAHDAAPTIEATVALAESLLAQGRLDEAAEVAGRADGSSADDAWRARLSSAWAGSLFWAGRASEAVDILDGAIAACESPSRRGQLVARRATFVMLGGRPTDALDAVEPLLDDADPQVRSDAADVAGPALVVMGRIGEGIEVADIGLSAAAEIGDRSGPVDAAPHLVARAMGLAEQGRIAEARASTEAGYDSTIEQRSLEGQAWFAYVRGRVERLAGDPSAAATAFAEGAVRFSELARTGLERWCVAAQAWCRAELGDSEAAQLLIDQLGARSELDLGLMEPDLRRARAWVAVSKGDLASAREHLEAAGRSGERSGSGALAIGAAHDLARIGDVDLAKARMDELGQHVDGALAAARIAVVDALAGSDAAAIEAAATRFEELGALLFAAETYAAAAAQYRLAGERRRADGMSLRCTTVLARCGGAHTPALRLAGEATSSLTRRELEIAELAARGLSNPEIAEQLVISVRTVANQLQRAYTKLGINARGDLGEALDRLS
jgi:DNA-binding CsgD family transcriptional regulator